MKLYFLSKRFDKKKNDKRSRKSVMNNPTLVILISNKSFMDFLVQS